MAPRSIRFRSFRAGADGDPAPHWILEAVRVARFTIVQPVKLRTFADGAEVLLPRGSFFDLPARPFGDAVVVAAHPLLSHVERRVWLVNHDGCEVAWTQIPCDRS